MNGKALTQLLVLLRRNARSAGRAQGDSALDVKTGHRHTNVAGCLLPAEELHVLDVRGGEDRAMPDSIAVVTGAALAQ